MSELLPAEHRREPDAMFKQSTEKFARDGAER